MTTMLEMAPTRRIAVVEDNDDTRETLCSLARKGGMEPLRYGDGEPEELQAIVERICSSADYALTDLRLRDGWDVDFDGAVLASELYKKGIPTVVVSEFTDDDAVTVLRPHRRYLPSVLQAGAVTVPEAIRGPLELCRQELAGDVPRNRRAWRAVIRVERVVAQQGDILLQVVIPEWDLVTRVGLPLSMLPAHMQRRATEGKRLVAMVNTDAETADEIFFSHFEDILEEKS